ncbi:MAG TPA: EAL domain-containing protein [Actinospica sp.]|jgi:diguanylate cyclase (GGDEF)-like protein|nr:EAL domain-containing protein [Actinospica sp.]
MRARPALSWYLASEACLLLVCPLLPPLGRSVIWLVVGVAAVGALSAGPMLARLDRLPAWRLLAFAGLLLLASNYIVLGDDMRGDGGITVPSTVDFLACGAFPLAAIAVLVIAMRGSPLALWARLVDTLIVLAGLSLFTWTLLVVPLAGNALPSTAVRAYAVTFALGDAFILVILGRLLYPDPRRAPAAVWMLLVGTAMMLGADVLFSLVELAAIHIDRDSALGIAQTTVWTAGLVCWGGAALSPSAAAIVQPITTPPRTPPPRRSALLALAAIAPAVAVMLAAAIDRHDEGGVIAVFGTVIALLLVARLSLALAQADARLRAEQTLGAAADRLVAANDTGEILGTVLDAATVLAGPGEPRIAVAAVAADDELLTLDNDARRARRVEATDPEEWIDENFGDRPHATLGHTAEDTAAPAALALGVAQGPVGLGERLGQLRILASQASLALSRLGLTREISRRDNEAYFRALVDDASDAIVLVDQTGHVRYASPSAVDLFREPDPAALDLTDLLGASNAAWVAKALGEPPGHGGSASRVDWALDRPGAGRLELEVACSDLRADPTVQALVLTLRDVTARRRLERDLRHHAYHDRLTGMGNRLKFSRRVELAMATTRANGPVLAVVQLDLDNFRELNEVHGREFGDLILITTGNRLAQAPGVLEAARFESDAYAVLFELPDASPAACLDVAEKIAAVVAEPFNLPAGQVRLTSCVGVAPGYGETRPEDVIRNARLALEAAKAAGRDAIRCYAPEMLRARLEHAQLHSDLQDAITSGMLELRYQPVVELATGRIASFEALVRWPHPERGLITPDKFIPLAEETGLIVPLGRWIIASAAQAAAELRAEPRAGDVRVAVNVSARQFSVPGLTADIAAGLADAGIGPDALIVELTESALMRHADEDGPHDLNALKGLGVGLAIDDFGTGYSSLSYLHDLPFDALKIDKSFIDEITVSPRRMDLVRGIIRIADSLGLYVVAEGLESDQQRALLAEAGCRYGQGFLFARPVPLETARTLLREHGGVISPDWPAEDPAP